MDTKVTAAGAVAAGAGVAQTFILREKVDRKYPTKNIPAMKGFGCISALAGMIGGGTGLAIGAIGSSKDRTGRQRLADIYNEAAIDYGATALVSGLLSGIFPAVTEADCVAAGGYYYNGACHLNPPTGATSLGAGAPAIQTAAYKAPIPHLESTDVYKKLTAEIQRLNAQTQALAQENAQLKAMNPLEVRGGTIVRNPRAPSGFMTDTETAALPAVAELYPIGHPETGTRRAGFMGEAMASNYGF